MKRKISWTHRCEDGVAREVRVDIKQAAIKWQFKRKDEPQWDYDSAPTREDWDALEEILGRRAGRGAALVLQEIVRKIRHKAGA
ncbi:MAG: hypothetical protein HN919_12400 [Verrucomicrobia bacterium]|jgi:hypothetical protein|nr:hypothetical protein [Verrucomicrobiota bacterium]MBT7699232.1 hypothetical protein [Verrucomicrobiota bacterium]